MNIDDIVCKISKMNWNDLIKVGTASQERMKYLNKLELKKYKQGTHVKIKDTEGNFHDGIVWKVSSTTVKVELGRKKPIKFSPHLLTKWIKEFENRKMTSPTKKSD